MNQLKIPMKFLLIKNAKIPSNTEEKKFIKEKET
jgi:hypothetical protein